MKDDRPSSEEMIRRARDQWLEPPAPKSTQVESVEVDETATTRPRADERGASEAGEGPAPRSERMRPAPASVRRAPPPPPPPRPAPPSPGRPRRPGPLGPPPTGPTDTTGSSPGIGTWIWILVVLVGVGSTILRSTAESTDPGTTIVFEPATQAPAPVFLRDDFNGGISPGWEWLGGAPERWSVSEPSGSLSMSAGIPGESGAPNTLLRNAPDRAYEIVTYVEFRPTSNFQAAGLIVFDNGANLIQLVRGFCGPCAGQNGVYLDNVTDGGLPDSDGGHRVAGQPDGVYLRLRHSGSMFFASYSVDGLTWHSAGETSKSMDSPRIGLVAWPNDPAPPRASFDFFEVLPSN